MSRVTYPKNITELERRTYTTIKLRANFVALSINDLCNRSSIAPSTFSRWVNGHNGGHIKTIGKMDAILTKLEAKKFHNIEIRLKKLGLTLADICQHIQVPILDYVRWVRRELDPDYAKLSELESYLTDISTNQPKQETNNDPTTRT